jgi:hypothetical protein
MTIFLVIRGKKNIKELWKIMEEKMTKGNCKEIERSNGGLYIYIYIYIIYLFETNIELKWPFSKSLRNIVILI